MAKCFFFYFKRLFTFFIHPCCSPHVCLLPDSQVCRELDLRLLLHPAAGMHAFPPVAFTRCLLYVDTSTKTVDAE